MLTSSLCGEFLLHIRCWHLFFNLGSFSYTSRAVFIFMQGVSLTHPMLPSFFSEEFLLLLPGWLLLFFKIWVVSLTHPMLASFLCGEFLLHIPCCLDFYAGSFSYTSHIGFFLFLSGECLLHIPCWLHFYLGTFCYTSHAGFIFFGGVPVTRPLLALFLCG